MILVILSSVSFFLIKNSIMITAMAGKKNIAKAREWLAWIDEELRERDRSREWLANKGGFDSSKFSHIEAGRQGIGYEVATKAASALGIPPAISLERAGLQKGRHDNDRRSFELQEFFTQASDKTRDAIYAAAKALFEIDKRE